MVTLSFEPGENPLPAPVPVPISTLSPWPIQVSNQIKVKKSFSQILEDFKTKTQMLISGIKIRFLSQFVHY